jgi:hypothetical protein
MPDISTGLTPGPRHTLHSFICTIPRRGEEFPIYFLGGGTGPGQEPVLDTAAQFLKAVS